MWGSPESMGWWFLFGGFWMVVFWGIIIAVLFGAFRRLFNGSESRRPLEGTPLEIAKRRLASGEIIREEYDELLEVLR